MNRPLTGWDRSMFHNPDTSDLSCPEIIDLTGVARRVVFGPYIVLGAGPWRATMDLELCSDAARRHLVVEFGGAGNFSTVELPYGVPGRKCVSIVHEFADGVAAEARVYLVKAAFHGFLWFYGVTVERLDQLF